MIPFVRTLVRGPAPARSFLAPATENVSSDQRFVMETAIASLAETMQGIQEVYPELDQGTIVDGIQKAAELLEAYVTYEAMTWDSDSIAFHQADGWGFNQTSLVG